MTLRDMGSVPSDGALKLDDANAEDQVLIELQRFLTDRVDRPKCFDSFIVTPILAHLEFC